MIDKIIFIAILVIYSIVLFHIYNKNVAKSSAISFKESLDLTSLPIITFYQGENKLNFLLDTGSTRSMIHSKIENLQQTPLNVTTKITGAGGTMNATISTIKLTLNGREFEDDFQIADMTDIIQAVKGENGVNLHGILGNTFFNKYKYVIDFDLYKAYPVKR